MSTLWSSFFKIQVTIKERFLIIVYVVCLSLSLSLSLKKVNNSNYDAWKYIFIILFKTVEFSYNIFTINIDFSVIIKSKIEI